MCHSSSWSKSRCGSGRGPTSDIWPSSTLNSCGSSSSEKRRSMRPTLVMRGSSRILNSGPDASLSDSTSACMLVRARAHGAELEARERRAADAGPLRAVEDRPARGDRHRDRDQQQQRAEQQEQEQRAEEVERALDRVVEAVEHRRAQLEQRHRRARHELGAVDEDLHRRGRDPHRHPALVALVDELDRLALREVGVGDDDLLDPLGVEHRREVLDPAERPQPVVRPRRERDEADHLDRRVHLVDQGVRDVLDVVPGPDQQCAPAIAGRPQQHAGDPLVGPADAGPRRRSRRTASRRRCSSSSTAARR